MLVKRRHSRPIPKGATFFENGGVRYARWRGAAGKLKTRPLNRKGDRIVETSACWYVRLRDPDTNKLREWKAFTDRQASLAREVEIIKQVERGHMGIADARTRHRKTPLETHLKAFTTYLEDKANTAGHVDKTLARCRRIIKGIKAKKISNITAGKVESYLAKLRRGGMSVSTSNGYFRAIGSFCRWLVKDGRVAMNPIAGLSAMKVSDADKKRKRRNLTDDEFRALVDAARDSADPFMDILGTDRAMLYIVAANTGLRASELASLTPESFDLDDGTPTVRCKAAYTKNSQEAALPLRQDIAAMLRDWLEGRSAGQRLWNGRWASDRQGSKMIRADLEVAGVPYKDANDRYADFHALRHTFISNLARAGVHPRNAQALARHSTIDLTMNVYTHIAMEDLVSDIEAMPSVLGRCDKEPPAQIEDQIVEETKSVPAELAVLADSWLDLPEHIRQAIATLAAS
jgi:site-specific recombinase XerC